MSCSPSARSQSAEGFEAIPGYGVRATAEGRELQGGGPNLLAKVRVEPGPALREAAERFAARGQGAIYLVENGRALAAIAVADARAFRCGPHAGRMAARLLGWRWVRRAGERRRY